MKKSALFTLFLACMAHGQEIELKDLKHLAAQKIINNLHLEIPSIGNLNDENKVTLIKELIEQGYLPQAIPVHETKKPTVLEYDNSSYQANEPLFYLDQDRYIKIVKDCWDIHSGIAILNKQHTGNKDLLLDTLTCSNQSEIRSLCLSPDKNELLIGHKNGKLSIINLVNKECTEFACSNKPIMFTSFHGSNVLVSIDEDKTYLYNRKNGIKIAARGCNRSVAHLPSEYYNINVSHSHSLLASDKIPLSYFVLAFSLKQMNFLIKTAHYQAKANNKTYLDKEKTQELLEEIQEYEFEDAVNNKLKQQINLMQYSKTTRFKKLADLFAKILFRQQ